MLKLLVSFFLFSLLAIEINAQGNNLSVAFAIPKDQITENTQALKLLKNKLTSAMSKNNMSMSDYSGIIISAETIVIDQHVVEGGMKNIYTYNINLTLSIIQAFTSYTFNSVEITLKGEGYSKEKAIIASIRNLSPENKHLTHFLKESGARIINYYTTNAENILSKARILANTKEYDAAIALLSSYPQQLPKSEIFNKTTIDVYKSYQHENCLNYLQKAKGAYALGNYDESIDLLIQIDMTSPCAKEADHLATQIRKSIDAENLRKLNLYNKELQLKQNMELRRIQLIENIAKAYYKNQPKYYFIF